MSHSDDDHAPPKPVFLMDFTKPHSDAMLDALIKKAERMTAEGRNTITAGAPGEQPISQTVGPFGILVRRMPNDEHGVLRVSIGESREVAGSGYIVYRGEPRQILDLLQRATMSLRAAIE